MTLHVYTGPTLTEHEVLETTPYAVVHPPVGHGDLLRGHLDEGDIVVIIDGLYHQQAPVRHKEILLLLDRGVHVIGCSSMGALRAAELHPCGMIGHGRVFEMYRDGEIEADDEVAVTHGRARDLSSRNTPLVNVRWAARAAREAGLLDDAEVAEVVSGCVELHYTERSWRMLRLHLERTGRDPLPVDRVLDFLAAHPEHASVKRRDAFRTLAVVEELVREPARVVADEAWQNRYAYEWAVAHRGELTEHGPVTDRDLLGWHQLFSDTFVGQWQAFVLGELAQGPSSDDQVVEHWLSALGVSSAGELPCLTAAERAALSPAQAVVRSLARGFESPRAHHDLLHRFPELASDPEARDQTRTALRTNAETWWRGRERLVERLSESRLTGMLAEVWGCPATDEELTAAARDRGLATLDDALDVARVHFLAHQGRRSQRPRWRVS